MKTSPKLTVVLALFGWAAHAHAAEYEIAKGSRVQFLAKITGGSFVATCDQLKGKVSYDETASRIKAADVSARVNAIDTGLSLRNDHMRNKYLQEERYPAIHFHIENAPIPAAPGTKGTVEGTFTIKDKTQHKSIELTVERAKAPKHLSVHSVFPLNILDYGIPQPTMAIVSMEPVIEVTVDLILQPEP